MSGRSLRMTVRLLVIFTLQHERRDLDIESIKA